MEHWVETSSISIMFKKYNYEVDIRGNTLEAKLADLKDWVRHLQEKPWYEGKVAEECLQWLTKKHQEFEKQLYGEVL